MKKIEYDIKFNDDGNPYIHLDKGKLDLEDRLFCFEIVRYSLYQMIEDNNGDDILPENFITEIANSGNIIGQLSNELGDMLIERDKAIGDIDDILNSNKEKE